MQDQYPVRCHRRQRPQERRGQPGGCAAPRLPTPGPPVSGPDPQRSPPGPLTLVVHTEGGRRPGPQQPLEELGDAVVDGLVAGGRRQGEAADLAGRLLLAQQVGFHRQRRHGCGAAGIAAGSREGGTLVTGVGGAGGGRCAAAL